MMRESFLAEIWWILVGLCSLGCRGCILYWGAAAIKAGHIPTYNQPDPGTLQMGIWREFGEMGFLLAFIFGFLALFPIPIFMLYPKQCPNPMILVLGTSVIAVAAWLTFGPYLEWMLD